MPLSLRIVAANRSSGRTAKQRNASTVATLLTFGRLPVAGLIVVAALAQMYWLALIGVVGFIVWDIFDGVLARAFNAETRFRRGADGVIDKISIHAVAIVVVASNPLATAVWLVLLSRDLAQGVMGYAVWKRTGLIAAGAKWHRCFTLATAAWGGCLLLQLDGFVVLASGVVVLCGAITLFDYARQMRLVVRPHPGDSLVEPTLAYHSR